MNVELLEIEDDLVGYWTFNAPIEVKEIEDMSGNNNTVAIISGAEIIVSTSPTNLNGALYLDGVNGKATIELPDFVDDLVMHIFDRRQ